MYQIFAAVGQSLSLCCRRLPRPLYKHVTSLLVGLVGLAFSW